MRKFIVCCAALAGLGSSALAADLPVKALPMAPPPFDWGGLYAGLGGSWFQNQTRWQYTNPGPATLTPFTNSQDTGAFDIQAGAQWQFSQIVLGVEASYTNPVNSFRGAVSNGTATSVCTAGLGQACQTRTSNVSTVGGRVGWAWADWLFFGEGGWAAGTIETQLVNSNGTLFDTSRNSDYLNGWYAGGGVNYAAYKSAVMDVIVGVDYRHIDLRTHFQSSSADGFSGSPPGVNGRNVGGTADQVRFTVSLKTNGWNFAAPVMAKY
jgi:outer membrane immunogenic protein